jgi:multicomponent Na+:H+ antiporter subunit D
MNLIILPILIPAFAALTSLLVWRPSRTRRAGLVAACVAQLLVSVWLVALAFREGPQALALGGWPAPFGIILVVDLFAAIMLTLSALIGGAAIIYGMFELPIRVEHPLRLPLTQLLLLGVNHSFITGDLFNLFVAFEVMLLASYALITLEADDWDIKQAFPYLALNLFGSAFLLSGAGLAYGIFGTLNFAEIAVRAEAMSGDPRIVILAVLLLLVFGIKSGLFPLYFWLPNSYPILPTPLAAIYAGLLTKVGVYALLRLFATVLPHDMHALHSVVAWAGGVTMVLGVIGAVSRNFIRGILSFHILSQIGYMILAIGLFTPYSVAAAIFYNIHNNIVKSTLFLVGGTATVLNRSDDLKRSANLWVATPLLGITFLVLALSLAGIPPLSGFWGKLMIVQAGIAQREYVLVTLALGTGALTLFSMMKIWNTTFWAENEDVPVRLDDRRWRGMAAVAGVMAAITVAIALGAEGVLNLATEAARQAMDRNGYVEAVFGAK